MESERMENEWKVNKSLDSNNPNMYNFLNNIIL